MSTSTTMEAPQSQSPLPTEKHRTATREEWIAARKALLKKEKDATRLLDELAEERRHLPRVKLEKDYVFEGPGGRVSLADLFEGRSQLLIYHFMFGPDWQEGCPSCSFVSDHFDGALPHLAARDVSMAAVSRAPLAKLEAFKTRMGWRFPWVSSSGTDFNFDFHVSFPKEDLAKGRLYYNYEHLEFPSEEAPGLSAFCREADGTLYHTYSTYGRGLDQIMSTYRLLDLAPKGRDEDAFPFPMAWVRYHDKYGASGKAFADEDKPYWPQDEAAEPAATAACGCGKAEANA